MCTPSLKYFIDYVESTAANTSENAVLNRLNVVLSGNGVTLNQVQSSSICRQCIGDFCSLDNGYILSSTNKWVSFRSETTARKDCQEFSLRCCFNFFGSLLSLSGLNNFNLVRNDCCGDYSDSDDSLFSITAITSSMTINDLGVVEYGGPYLKILKDYFSNKSQFFRYNYIYALLTKGLVIKFLESPYITFNQNTFWFGSIDKWKNIC